MTTRFCLWGDRHGDVHVGSATDRAMQRRMQRQRRFIRSMSRQMAVYTAIFQKISVSASQVGTGLVRLQEALVRDQRRKRRRARAQWPLWQDYKRGV